MVVGVPGMAVRFIILVVIVVLEFVDRLTFILVLLKNKTTGLVCRMMRASRQHFEPTDCSNLKGFMLHLFFMNENTCIFDTSPVELPWMAEH